MKSFRLKCKSPKGQFVIDSLSATSPLLDLLQSVSRLTGLPNSRIALKVGFPPQKVDLSHPEAELSGLGIQSGDTVIVEQGPEVSKPELVRVPVPADNSCLFTSVNFCITGGTLDTNCAPRLRRLIADRVVGDPENFSEAMLGMTAERYCEKLLREELWGGGIEISVLSQHFCLEIAVVDVQTVRIDHFGEDQNHAERILILYDGIHYDPLAFRDNDRITTKFPVTELHVLERALELAGQARAQRQFTDTGNFSLRCIVCSELLKGESEAQQHAKATGHASFGEV